MSESLIVRYLGVCDYQATWDKMQAFTANRDADTQDELWLLQHPPVYTQGVSGKAEHVLDPHGIPIIQSNRGGQVTYHGPGQIVGYVLLDLRRLDIGIRRLVTHIEETIIALLAQSKITANARADAPGVYVNNDKVAALGLRVSKGCSYHGLALNVDMDLQPFSWINPCGYKGLGVTSLRKLGINTAFHEVEQQLAHLFARQIGYTIAPAESV